MSKERLLAKYEETAMDGDDEDQDEFFEDINQTILSVTDNAHIRNQYPNTDNNIDKFSQSVIRYNTSANSNNNNNGKFHSSEKNIDDLFGELNIDQHINNSNPKDKRVSLSIVHEDKQETEDSHFETLTAENIEKFNRSQMEPNFAAKGLRQINKIKSEKSPERKPSQLKPSSKSLLLQKYMDNSGEEEEEAFDLIDENEISNKVSQTKNLEANINKKKNEPIINQTIKRNKLSSLTKKKSTIKNIHLPLSKDSITFANSVRIQTSKSLNSLSSSTESSRSLSSSSYEESSDTEQSDYAENFDHFDDDIDLITRFQKHQKDLEEKVTQSQYNKQQKIRSLQKRANFKESIPSDSLFEYDHSAFFDDFEDFDELQLFDKGAMHTFVKVQTVDQNYKPRNITNNTTIVPSRSLRMKKSMPLLSKTNFSTPTLLGSPQKRYIRKSSSTMELPHVLNDDYREQDYVSQPGILPKSYSAFLPTHQNPNFRLYTGDELDNIELLPEADTPSNKHRFHPVHRNHSSRSTFTNYATPVNKEFPFTSNTNNGRLIKEGKLRAIRQMGRHNTRKVMQGHKYGEMVYDPSSKKWFGNEDELTSFDSLKRKPGLIRNTKQSNLSNEDNGKQIVGNMMFDTKKLRWVSMTGSYEDDPFVDMDNEFEDSAMECLDDHAPKNVDRNFVLQQRRISSNSKDDNMIYDSKKVSRKASKISRSISLGRNMNEIESFLHIDSDQVKSWKNEENRWSRKVRNWFPNDDATFDFCYELRNLLKQSSE
ncbi:unnamed protein product [[Candida] boidinii]|uniref:Unnamed protein product n=1 Tax=Candida boidinii TaxID=5477 RepID=A0A9W6WD77_CANBO|nr:hypothetical protein B5S30_g2649 [[Candida] boidinii]GME66765.1 unnamed protein product [[Candida] boidinii]